MQSDNSYGTKMSKKSVVLFMCVLFLLACAASYACFSAFQSAERAKSLEQEIESLERENAALQKRYQTAAQARDDLLEETQELAFWWRYAVIVTREGEKYHTYGCQYIQGREFWIYNVDAAIDMGYEPCSVCNPPDHEPGLKKMD